MYYTDEMRYGTRTESKRRWTRQGHRPQCKVKIGYEWGYLYVAICPTTGDMFSCFASHLDKDCFSYFVNEFKAHLQEQGIEQTVLLIGDGATAHQARLMPEGIDWLKLPTACPELNPVERFFEELRKVLANRIFESKQLVEECLHFWIHDWEKRPNDIRKLTNFK